MAELNKKAVIEAHRTHETDTGSAEVQIAILTTRINSLSDHFRRNGHDHSGRRGLVRLVGRRRRLLKYLNRSDAARYQTLVDRLGLRK